MQASVEKTASPENGYTFLKHIGKPVPKSKLVGKRICDVVFGVIFGIISLPIIFIFAILIKLNSKGPVFFKQKRVGYLGKPITIVKLRSMRNDAEKKTGAVWAKKKIHGLLQLGVLCGRRGLTNYHSFGASLRGI